MGKVAPNFLLVNIFLAYKPIFILLIPTSTVLLNNRLIAVKGI